MDFLRIDVFLKLVILEIEKERKREREGKRGIERERNFLMFILIFRAMCFKVIYVLILFFF